MDSELDKIKSTITISLGTKNRLRKLKGSDSYEQYINFLLRQLQKKKEIESSNYLEIQKFERISGLYSFEDYKILFIYNKYNASENFIFDISIDTVRKKGKIVTFKHFLENISENNGKDILRNEFQLYFLLLEKAIRNDIEPFFKHNGRFEDYYSWQKEFRRLGLSDKTFDEEVMDKLKSYKHKMSILQ